MHSLALSFFAFFCLFSLAQPSLKFDAQDLAFYPCQPSHGKPLMWVPLKEGVSLSLTPYGYVNWEILYDSRQTINSQEEHFFIFPAPYRPDRYGRDINSHPEWNMLAIETRLGILLRGPQWGCISTSAIIEGDFLGTSIETVSSFRQRHSYAQISWPTGSLLLGQFWHPLFILECFPYTVTFGVGAPMEPQARDPQVRLVQNFGSYQLTVALLGQRDFGSPGPLGISSIYMINSVTPNTHLQLRKYFAPNNLIGIAGDYKRLVPRIVSDKNVKVNESINSFIFEAFAAINIRDWSLRMKAFFAQNGADQIVLGGYAVHTVNPQTDCRTYTNIASAGGWLDYSYTFCSDQMELGLFVGYIKNLGSRKSLYFDPKTNEPIIYDLTPVGSRVDYSFAVYPRYVYSNDPIRFGLEVEYAHTVFGKPDLYGRINNGIPVNLVRILGSLYYIF